MNYKSIAIIVVLVVLLASGCASFPTSTSAKRDAGEFAFSKPTKLKIFYEAEVSTNFYSSDVLKAHQNRDLFSVVERTNCCVMASDESNADVRIHTKISKYENPAALIPAAITGFSLYTIPSFATTQYTINANVTNKEMRAFEYELHDEFTLVQWLPMMFAFPFFSPFDAEEKTLSNMFSDLLSKMHADHVI